MSTTTNAEWVTNPRWSEPHLLLPEPRERFNANTYGRTACGRQVNVGAVEADSVDMFRCERCVKRAAEARVALSPKEE